MVLLTGVGMPAAARPLTEACPSRCPRYSLPPPLVAPPPSPIAHVRFDSPVNPAPPQSVGTHTFELSSLLTPAECAAIISATENSTYSQERIYFGYGYRATDSTSSRRDVLRFWDDNLAAALAARLHHRLPVFEGGQTATAERRGQSWHLVGLNAEVKEHIWRAPGGTRAECCEVVVLPCGHGGSSAWLATARATSFQRTRTTSPTPGRRAAPRGRSRYISTTVGSLAAQPAPP